MMKTNMYKPLLVHQSMQWRVDLGLVIYSC